MSQNAAKNLETYILKSTDEKATHPDSQMFLEICNIINSRSDMPKLAIQIIKKRISSKNPKTVYLCLELLEVSANACELPFHNQVASKDFILVLNSLVSNEIDKTVFEKLIHLVQYWSQLFEGSKDILPGFFEFKQALEKKRVQFPSYVESKYSYLLKNKPKSSTKYTSDDSDTKTYSTKGDTYGGSSSSKQSSSTKGLSSKLKKDFELVKENITLTNELIDNHDPREDVTKNDVLSDLIQTLRTMENKLVDFVQKQNDEETLKYCLELNDDLNKTIERYKILRKGGKPKPFVSSSYNEATNQEITAKSKKIEQNDFFKDQSFKPSTNSISNSSKQQKVVNLFDDDLLDSQPSQQQKQEQPEQKKTNANAFSGFDDFSSPPPSKTTTNTTSDPFSTSSKPTSNTTNTSESLVDKINSLYKNPESTKTSSIDAWDSLSTVNMNTNNVGGGFGNQNAGGWGGNNGGGFNTVSYGGNQGGFGGNQGGFGGNQGGFGGNQGGFGGNQGGFGGNQGGFGGNQGFNTQSFGGNQGGNQGGFGGNQGGFGGNQGGFNTVSGGYGGNQLSGGFGGQNNGGFGGNQGSFGGNSFGNQNQGLSGGNGWGGSSNNFNTSTTGGYGNSGGFGGGNSFSTQPISNGNVGTKSSNPFDMSDLGTNLETQKKVQTNKNLFDDLM